MIASGAGVLSKLQVMKHGECLSALFDGEAACVARALSGDGIADQ